MVNCFPEVICQRVRDGGDLKRWWDHGKCWCPWRCALWGLPCLLSSFTSQLWNSHFCHDVPPWSNAAWPTKHIQNALKLDPNKLFLCVNSLKYFINNNKSLPNRSKMETTKRLTKIYFIKQLNLLSTKLNLSYLKCNVLKKKLLKCMKISVYVTSTRVIHIKVDLHLNGVQGWIFTVQQSSHTKLEENIAWMLLLYFPKHSSGWFVCVLNFETKSLQTRLVSNSLCCQGWSWIYNPPVPAPSPLLRLPHLVLCNECLGI